MKKQTKKFANELLEQKKEKFIQEVVRSADSLGYPIPYIKFWEVRDGSHFNKGERAHIHVDKNLICIPNEELEIMSYEEIEDTASHEVAHLKEQNHDYEFQKVHSETKADLWRPSSGLTHIHEYDDSKFREAEKKQKKQRRSKSYCNYHLCKKKGKTYKCKYCGGYFCSKHKDAKPPTLPPFKNSSPIGKLLMEEYQRDDAHPCPDYVTQWYKEKKEEGAKWGETLDILTGKNNKRYVETKLDKETLDRLKEIREDNFNNLKGIVPKKEKIPYEQEEEEEEEKKPKIKKKIKKEDIRKKVFVLTSIIIIIAFISLFYLYQNGYISNETYNIKKSFQLFEEYNSLRYSRGFKPLIENATLFEESYIALENNAYSKNIRLDLTSLGGLRKADPSKVAEWLYNEVRIKTSNNYTQGSLACYQNICEFNGK